MFLYVPFPLLLHPPTPLYPLTLPLPSPSPSADHTFNAADVNRKVTETLLLKQLASHPTARMHNLAPLLLPQAKSTQQATCSALASLCEATSDSVVKAASLYALCLYLSNRSKVRWRGRLVLRLGASTRAKKKHKHIPDTVLPPQPQPAGTVMNITPLAVNAALTASPKYSREEIENESKEEFLSGNSAFCKHKRRMCGWVSEAPWGGDYGKQVRRL
jgi:hypothetical protein